MEIYNLQKEINDFDYQANINEVKLKRQFDTEINQGQKEYETFFQDRFDQVEAKRNNQYELEDKKGQMQRQLENLLQCIFSYQNEREQMSDKKETAKIEHDIKLKETSNLETKVKKIAKQ